jgi:hypothetical protein
VKRRDVPDLAKGILADGEFCYVAARTRFGPHLTPVVYALDGGRLWLTTARGSVKARAWRADPHVAGMVRVGDRAVVFRGVVKTYDALDPFTWPSAAVSSPRLGKAATKFSMKNARFFFGYARDAYRVPLAWAPPGRVFTAIDLRRGQVLDLAEGTIEDGWGSWPRRFEPSASFAVSARRKEGVERLVPERIVEVLGSSGDAALATQVDADGDGRGGAMLTVLPASWEHVDRSYAARVPMSFAELTGAGPKVRAALTIDRPALWRAAEMRGVLLRGDAETFAPGLTKRGAAALRLRAAEGEVLLRLVPARAVWWEGWTSGTVGEPASSPPRLPVRTVRARSAGAAGAR